MFMKFKTIQLLFLCFISIQLVAQNDFRPGYIILNSGDTLKGKLDYCRDANLETFCRFKAPDNDSVIEYTPADIAAYSFSGGRYFVSKQLQEDSSNKVFFEFLFRGKVDIYSYGGSFYIEKQGLGLHELPYQESINYVDNVEYAHSTKTHIGILVTYMQDVPELKTKIENTEKLNKQTILRLAKDYHKKSGDNSNYTIYGTNLPLIGFSVQPVMGFVKYPYFNNVFRDIGIYTQFNSPQKFDRLYFKTGFIYHKIYDSSAYIHVYKIPLQFEYLFKRKGIIPKVALGINFSTLINTDLQINMPTNTCTIGCGFQYKVFSKLDLSATINYEFTPLSKAALGLSILSLPNFGNNAYYCHFGLVFLID